MADQNHIAEARKKVGRPQIREAFLRNGAVIPADRDDLPDYVYESVFELMELAAPAVQGEPVAIVCNFSEGSGPQPTFVEAEVGGKSVSFEWRDRPDGLKEMLVPQSVTPDVSRLVEALELIEKGEDTGPDGWGAFRWADCRNIARAALADHRKQGGEV